MKELNDCVEKDEFPTFLLKGLKDLGFRGFHI